jgi:Cu2+-exporting ATPase
MPCVRCVDDHTRQALTLQSTDVAIESAGVVLASSDPRGVSGVIRLSRASYRKMVENLSWAAGYNVLPIPLA